MDEFWTNAQASIQGSMDAADVIAANSMTTGVNASGCDHEFIDVTTLNDSARRYVPVVDSTVTSRGGFDRAMAYSTSTDQIWSPPMPLILPFMICS